ncbi:TAP-like protein-domain-containing protein [Schizophyllum amplum]|uniref:TAP-like protein-domain-containing protein n=1 Tax=Schizophyllum amplum TaxID=97359 RepID=A0A550C562_9AGAR|nr:TAP-like protein-domain-containing protein [Auriculariopsis ampla]
MLYRSAILLTGGVTAITAFSLPLRSEVIEHDAEIDWFSCGDLDPQYSYGDELNITCGYYNVPLDWADDSVGTASLAVVLYPATKDRRGTMFANPGGPGGSGVEYILEFGPNISSKVIGGHYDIVSWDPRGAGHTTPGPPSCFDSAEDWEEYFNGTLETTGLEIKGDLTDGSQLQQFYSHVPEMEKKYRGLGKRCAQKDSGKTLAYLGSAAAARDMVALAEYFDPGVQEINYWGISYGSMIGFIFVNMFPDRVGHVVLDGCMEPLLYANEPTTDYYLNNLASVDETFNGFTTGCAMAGQDGCKLVQGDNDTAADIATRVRGLLGLAHDLLESGADLSGTYTSAQAREYLYGAMYSPLMWSEYANFMYAYEQTLHAIASNISEYPSTKPDAGNGTDTHTYEFVAILCGDGVNAGNMTMRSGFDAIVQASEYVSPLFGPQWHVDANICFAWPARAVERYTGPWDNKLKNSILVIGNTFDPVTPFKNAQLMADLLGDSAVLLQQNGYGHVSLAEPSTCTVDVINRYFEDGTLPEGDDTICPIDDDVVLFPNSTVSQASVRLSILAAGQISPAGARFL